MTRFIQQRIKPLISRFIPKAWCPACGNVVQIENKPQTVSLKNGQKKEGKAKVKRNKKEKKTANG